MKENREQGSLIPGNSTISYWGVGSPEVQHESSSTGLDMPNRQL